MSLSGTQCKKLISLVKGAMPPAGQEDTNLVIVLEALVFAYILNVSLQRVSEIVTPHLEKAIDNATNENRIELLCDAWVVLNPDKVIVDVVEL